MCLLIVDESTLKDAQQLPKHFVFVHSCCFSVRNGSKISVPNVRVLCSNEIHEISYTIY